MYESETKAHAKTCLRRRKWCAIALGALNFAYFTLRGKSDERLQSRGSSLVLEQDLVQEGSSEWPGSPTSEHPSFTELASIRFATPEPSRYHKHPEQVVRPHVAVP